MRVLLINPYYEPDLGPNAPLFTMLAEDLVSIGHKVTVVAAVPHLPTGKVWNSYRGKLIDRATVHGVEVVRVWVPDIDRTRITQRLRLFVAFQLLATAVGAFSEFDVLISSNPAIETGLPFLALTRLRQKPGLYSMQDVYPDVGVRLGIFRSAPVIRVVELSERLCLQAATCVRILSPSFRQTYMSRRVPASKMVLIHDWVDTDLITPLPWDNTFAREQGLADSFVVMYAGNVGLSQGLDVVLDVAARMVDHSDIRFVIVGDGAEKERLRREAASRGLPNLRFIGFQPRDRLAEILGTAHISLLTLKPGLGNDALPSKIYSILASGRPVSPRLTN